MMHALRLRTAPAITTLNEFTPTRAEVVLT